MYLDAVRMITRHIQYIVVWIGVIIIIITAGVMVVVVYVVKVALAGDTIHIHEEGCFCGVRQDMFHFLLCPHIEFSCDIW